MARVSGLNHVTLAVSDLDKSLGFCRDLLGLGLRARWAEGACVEAGSLWLCLSRGPVSPRADDTHLAFDVAPEDIAVLAGTVHAAAPAWRKDRSEKASAYVFALDGHRLELHAGSLRSRLDHDRPRPEKGAAILDAGPA